MARRALLAALAAASICIAAAYNPAALLGPRWQAVSGTQQTNPEQIRDGYSPEAEADRVKTLPGIAGNQLDFGLFGGYITVDDKAGRALYYLFAESKTNAAEHPLVLWLNGGPGCSSIGGGFLSELGPFYPNADGDLIPNPHAWNLNANVLFIESPAFVGFSYSNTTDDLDVGDKRTAKDLVVFLQKFVDRFPAYKGRDFWISGESYGGHYVPNLAAALLDAEEEEAVRKQEVVRKHLLQQGGSAPRDINLQGFLVGNAWTDPEIDNRGTLDFWWYHGLISDETKAGVLKHCNFSTAGPLYTTNETELRGEKKPWPFPSEKCQELLNLASLEIGNINIYDIYVDVCLRRKVAAAAQQLGVYLTGTAVGAAASAAGLASERLSDASGGIPGPPYDPCIDDEVTAYFNRPEVQQALHVPTAARPAPKYAICSREVRYSRTDLFTSMLPVYKRLLAAKLKMLVFSGDIDGIVPLAGTRRWINTLGLNVTQPWRPWVDETGQVGGRVVGYDGLTLATVRAAGHMVPYTQPGRAAWLLRHWIHGKPL